MNHRNKARTIGSLLLAVIFATGRGVHAQEPAPPPSPSLPSAVSQPAPSPPAATPAPTPKPDFWHRETMTGDWAGDRTRLKGEGLEIDMELASFYQGTTSGGVRHDSVYNGKLEFALKLDFGKMSEHWKWWSSEIKTEWRYGGPLLGGTGALNPVNTTAIIPGSAGSVVSITALNFTRLIPKDLKKGDLYAVSFGRFSLLDLIDVEFFGGGGTERFFNMAQIGPLTVAPFASVVTLPL